MRRTCLFGGVACCVLAAVWGCGLDDTAVVAIDGDASDIDSSLVDASPGNDASSDTGVADTGVKDTGIPDAGPCPAGDITTCDNGICSSTSEVCTPPVSAGWTVVNYISGARPTCSAGYAAHDVVEIADGGPSACLCNCSAGDAPTCATDRLTISSGPACGSSTGFNMTGSCADNSLSIAVATSFEAQVSARPGTCSGETDASFPDPDGGLSRECTPQTDAGLSNLCAEHRACIAKPASGKACIAHASPATCPTGFSPINVADSFGDTRSCPSCACDWNNSGCNVTTVTGYATSGNCGTPTGADTTISTSACNPVAALAFNSFGVSGTDTAATCGVTDAGAVDGGVAITNDQVICCAN